MKQELSIGISPCPNDTYIFYALIHGLIMPGLIDFKVIMEDVETLNQLTQKGIPDICKISYHALGFLLDDYCLLHSGGALGRGCGPLLLSDRALDLSKIERYRVAIPGEMTTAFLLMQLALPGPLEIITAPFNLIMDMIQNNEVDIGLVIHESRFTFHEHGLVKLLDLGDWWEAETGLPIPLGGIAAKRCLGKETIYIVEDMIRKSIEYSIRNPDAASEYITQNAQELSADVTSAHIDLYVNDFSLDLGDEGKKAVYALFDKAVQKSLIPALEKTIFIN